MQRHWITASVLAALVTAAAWGQSSDPNSSANTPQDRVRGGYLQANAPGVIIRQAISRHSEFQAERVTRARFGGDPNVATESSSGGSSAGTNTNSLLNLLNQFGGGSLGISSIGDLAGLVSGLTNLGGVTTSTGSGTSSTSTSGSGSSSTGVDPRLQALLDLRDANIGNSSSSDSAAGSTLKSNQRSSTTREFGGAIAKLWKPEDRAQSTTGSTTEDRSFKDRLLESWATAGFTAMSVAFQTDQFVTILEDGLRSIFRPKAGPGLVSFVQSLAALLDALQNAADSANGNNDTGGSTGGDTGSDTGGSTGGNDNTTTL